MQVKEHVGIVVSDKMDKTIVVAVENRVVHQKYGKVLVRTKRYKVHDEENTCKVGDRVRIYETKPLSKTKRWRVHEILKNSGKSSPMIEANFTKEEPVIYRIAEALFPKRVLLGEEVPLEINVSIGPLNKSKTGLSRKRSVKIGAYILVSDLDFETDEKVKVIEITPDSESSIVIFNLTPKSEGLKTIEIDFFQGSRYLGQKEVKTEVIKKLELKL